MIAFFGNKRLAELLDVPARTVGAWRLRNSIPGPRLLAVVRAAENAGVPQITLGLLAEMAERTAAGAEQAAAPSPQPSPARGEGLCPEAAE
ncbi:hypothetical protein A6302_03474 [Methylobrevis pamukkalensis]|uniref:Uncharacterized protein n=1 Tax=Methylobrevis pamukkalensis TaxID=1439726 RepID=A0A1E3GYV0_9HYPH|nr:hypothetical protein A6302_03474 [Methylobrevis pamukkalensis]